MLPAAFTHDDPFVGSFASFGGTCGHVSNPAATAGASVVQLPTDLATDPASFCFRWSRLHSSVRQDVHVAVPPVVWLAPPLLQLVRGAVTCGVSFRPLWWAGGVWRELPELPKMARHTQTHSSYVPRRFDPSWHTGQGLLRPVEEPLAAGPEQGHNPVYGSTDGVVRFLSMLLCERDGVLWARPHVAYHWLACPQTVDFRLGRTEAFEVCGGDRYILLLRGRRSGPDAVVAFDVRKNRWVSPVGLARTSAGGHGSHPGEAPVRWRPVDGVFGQTPRRPPLAPLRAWMIESTANHLTMLAQVSRDGRQRGGSEDVHTAVHFFGRDGEVVTHHLPCTLFRLTVQRYDDYVIFVKDFGDHPFGENACMDDNWHPTDARVAAWVWAVDDVATPPLPVHLPRPQDGFVCGADAGWSVVLARGCLEEAALGPHHTHLDTAPRLYLLQVTSTVLRLWVSRRVDDKHGMIFERRTLDGTQHLRHSLTFTALGQNGEVKVGEDESAPAVAGATVCAATAAAALSGSAAVLVANGSGRARRCTDRRIIYAMEKGEGVGAGAGTLGANTSVGGKSFEIEASTELLGPPGTPSLRGSTSFGSIIVPSLWSPDLRHAIRVTSSMAARPSFWRCAVSFTGEESELRSHAPRAYAAPAESAAEISPAEVFPVKPFWEGADAPSELCRGGVVVDGLPCFPTFRWGEADFHRPQNRWTHTLGMDTTIHATKRTNRGFY
eukprot:TRINITY_DN18986_c0_g1_i1.p1 TRINITY_DN18986_c0_g1~~TRINITY_DN18986_c0_g1_i1.p1  ORF type:complete len:721 (-),score=53.43 TRINITY_DN18986_c0_g1_i1:104-2266(-)